MKKMTNELTISNKIAGKIGGCSSMVEREPSKLDMRVRSPSPAQGIIFCPCSSVVEHSLGKGEVASSILAMGTAQGNC